jgi:hypothetical protein
MKKHIRFKTKYVSILLILCGCTNSTAPVTSPSIQRVNAPLSSNLKQNSNSLSSPSEQDNYRKPAKAQKVDASKTSEQSIHTISSFPKEKDPDLIKLAGSDIPSQWVYSKEKAVACRINQWSSYRLITNIKLELTNSTSQDPVNIVYTLVVKDSDGGIIRLHNYYKDMQANITEFEPPLKKGETKSIEAGTKYVPAFSVNLKECRVAKKNENFYTLNPEMKDHVSP